MNKFKITEPTLETHPNIASITQRIGYNSLRRSAWIRGIADSTGLNADELARERFNPRSSNRVEEHRNIIEQSSEPNNLAVAMIGSASKWAPSGFIFLQREQNAIDTDLQTHLKDYVSIDSIYVQKQMLRRGLATVLTERALATQPQDLRVSFVTPYDNLTARRWGEYYGFSNDALGEHTQTIAGNMNIRCLRYVAESVGLVRENMIAKKPELFN